MEYTVHQLAKLAGVSVRTLHYYDEVGLLKPAYTNANGYRYYEEKQLVLLQQILFFRELDFSLEKIKEIMQSSDFTMLVAFTDQEKLLKLKKKRIEKLLHTIEKTIKSFKGGEPMNTDDTFSAFNDPTYQQYKEEVQEKWGQTDAYKQSMKRVGKMSKADLEKVKQEGEDIANTIADLLKRAYMHTSSEVQQQIERFYKHLQAFYDPSYELFKGLGQMYVDDPRFTKYYEKRAKGLAAFMRDAMAFFAEEKLKR